MWNKLELTYEGTEQAKQTIVSLLIYPYELFKMKEGEFIKGTFVRFEKIIGELKAIGKTYHISDYERL